MLFFDRAMLLMANVLIIIGITILLGAKKTFNFFARKEKLKGTACFVVGIAGISAGFSMIGFFVECYGLLCLFADFFGVFIG